MVNSQAILFKYKSNILSWICTFVLMHSSTMIHMLTCTWVSCLNASSSRHTETKRKLSLADIPLPLLFYQGQNDYIPSGGSEISLGCRCPAAHTWCVGAARPFPAIALHPAREGAGGATNPSGKATACILTAGCVCRFSSCAVELSWTSFTFSHSSSSTHRSVERSFRSWSQSGWGGTPCSVDKLLRRSGARHRPCPEGACKRSSPAELLLSLTGKAGGGPCSVRRDVALRGRVYRRAACVGVCQRGLNPPLRSYPPAAPLPLPPPPPRVSPELPLGASRPNSRSSCSGGARGRSRIPSHAPGPAQGERSVGEAACSCPQERRALRPSCKVCRGNSALIRNSTSSCGAKSASRALVSCTEMGKSEVYGHLESRGIALQKSPGPFACTLNRTEDLLMNLSLYSLALRWKFYSLNNNVIFNLWMYVVVVLLSVR